MNNNIEYSFKEVAGVVVIYNPGQNVIENIISYINQINYLFIIDNSENPNQTLTEFSNSNHMVKYIFNNANLGVAESLNIAAKKAIEAKYSFLLTMDQDSMAPPDLVLSQLKIFQNSANIGIVSPLHSNRFGTHIKPSKESSNVMSVMTSGNLLNLDAYQKVGGFCDDFFIDYVDIEFCFKLNYNKYKIVRLSNIILEHNEADITKKKIFSKKIYPTNNAPFRMYYKTRNLLYLRERYKKTNSHLLKEEYKIYLRNVVKILLFEKQKFLKFKMIIIGGWDYFNRKKGRKF